MANQISHKSLMKVAAPYYGALSHPVSGRNLLYFLLDIHPDGDRISNLQVSVWNPAGGKLGNWLKDLGVQALFCNSIAQNDQQELSATGIQVESLAGTDISRASAIG